MKALEVKQVSYYEIGFSELEEFLQELFDAKEVSCVPEQTQNDIYLTFQVCPADCPLEEWDEDVREEFDSFLRGDAGYGTYKLETVMGEVCRRGLCPEGKYLLSISW